MAQRQTHNKNTAKRVPTSAVFTLDVNTVDEGANIIGFIESNIAVTRVMLVVTEAFDGTAPTLTVTDSSNGSSETHFTTADLSAEVVDTSLLFVPDLVTGTQPPKYRRSKTQWDCDITLGGSTVGEVKVVVEYVQLDTEPGLHTNEK